MADDIVQELHDWQHIVDESKGRAVVVMLSGRVFGDAADEIERLRAENAKQKEEILRLESLHWGTQMDNALLSWKEARRG